MTIITYAALVISVIFAGIAILQLCSNRKNKNELAVLSDRITTLYMHVDTVDERLTNKTDEIWGEVALNKQIYDTEKTIKTVTSDIIDSICDRMDSFSDRLDKIEQSNDILENCTGCYDSIRDFETKLKTIEDKVESLVDTVSVVDEEATRNVSKLQDKDEQLEARINAIDDQIDDQVDYDKDVADKVDDLYKHANDIDKYIDEMASKNKDADKAVTKFGEGVLTALKAVEEEPAKEEKTDTITFADGLDLHFMRILKELLKLLGLSDEDIRNSELAVVAQGTDRIVDDLAKLFNDSDLNLAGWLEDLIKTLENNQTFIDIAEKIHEEENEE